MIKRSSHSEWRRAWTGGRLTGRLLGPGSSVLATFRRKKHVLGKAAPEFGRARSSDERVGFYAGRWPGLRPGLISHGAADVDQVVGDHAKADPALDAGLASVSAAVQTVPSLDHADAALGAGPPLLPLAEPALLLLALALRALGGAIRDANALDAFGLCGGLVFARVEAGIGGHQVRRAPQPRLMGLDRRHQDILVAGPPIVDLIGDDDLVLRLLQFDHFAEFGW